MQMQTLTQTQIQVPQPQLQTEMQMPQYLMKELLIKMSGDSDALFLSLAHSLEILAAQVNEGRSKLLEQERQIQYLSSQLKKMESTNGNDGDSGDNNIEGDEGDSYCDGDGECRSDEMI
eukprot:TRINITY_DN4308_c0_g2_i1.p3 TRINITY_DN4308_c0_g2~~TRINITY_DN4308_c0_g2_i1.p3  ORF type:complete len:119 (+),score=38.82 TRINITY_DN4308_c0_g2_i1:352-708(+)